MGDGRGVGIGGVGEGGDGEGVKKSKTGRSAAVTRALLPRTFSLRRFSSKFVPLRSRSNLPFFFFFFKMVQLNTIRSNNHELKSASITRPIPSFSCEL